MCSVVDVCGGGAVAHRYSLEGYANPSIYCTEIKQLIEHANKRVTEQLRAEFGKYQPERPSLSPAFIEEFETTTGATPALLSVVSTFEKTQTATLERVLVSLEKNEFLRESIRLIRTLPTATLQRLAIQPSVVAWLEVQQKSSIGIVVHSIEGKVIQPDPAYSQQLLGLIELDESWPSVQRQDHWLKVPFGERIYFEDPLSAAQGQHVLAQALSLITAWKAPILEEMRLVSPEIQFIRDPSAHPDKIVSFSDNSVPGALFVQLKRSDGLVDACDLADSLIHEHRHQKLYLLQRVCRIVNADYPLVASPWREELRPPTGLFHALYVFVELLEFWSFLRNAPDTIIAERAEIEIRIISEKISTGFSAVESCDLTEEGRHLLMLLHQRYMALSAYA